MFHPGRTREKKVKGKEVVNLTEEVSKPITEERINEFLKLIKHSEYSVVQQLKKTLAKISLLPLTPSHIERLCKRC
jgi:Tfp pilus assembly pilus retraction ATPase PilT